MKTKEKLIWELAKEILSTHGDRVDSMDLIEYEEGGDERIKIYHGNGHCFELKKEYCCDPDEIDQYQGVDEEGYSYEFYEPWDDFTIAGTDKAIELLKEYANA